MNFGVPRWVAGASVAAAGGLRSGTGCKLSLDIGGVPRSSHVCRPYPTLLRTGVGTSNSCQNRILFPVPTSTCPICNGNKAIVCVVCGGYYGPVTCRTCNGSGTVSGQVCPDCHGFKVRSCTSCGGYSKFVCKGCNGAGVVI